MSKSDNTSYKKPISTDFSDGFYDWSIFIINLYLRVQQILKIDYESFMILQIVVGYRVSNLNKKGSFSISQLTFRFEEIVNKKAIQIPKLTVTSIASALNIPRETVKRKVDALIKEKYLSLDHNKSITLGINYQNVFQAFALETTYDLGKVMTRWSSKGYIDKLMSLIKAT